MGDVEVSDTTNGLAPIRGLVPMIHVQSVERSVAFYQLLGFEVGNYVPPSGPIEWAWLYQPKAKNWKTGANLMITRSARPLNPDAQDVLFYLYATDLMAVRSELVARGIKAGPISYPWYLPKGEFRTDDPDGYCLMIGQSTPDSP